MGHTSSTILNYIKGDWRASSSSDILEVVNPATEKTICTVPLSTPQEVDQVVQEANLASESWKRIPPADRIQYLFRSSGSAARKFRNQAEVGKIGINIGVAAPMAFFPFSGWKESFFGTLHGHSNHAVEFYTQTKVVIERWPREWSRKF